MVSPDGINWKLLSVPKLPSADESNMSYDRQTRTFIATLKCGGPYGRSVRLSTSKDFSTWKDHGMIFHADDLDQKLGRENIKARLADATLQTVFYNTPSRYNVDVYNMGVFRYEGLYIGVPAMYHAVGALPNYPNTVGFQMLQLTCSRDLKKWKRLGNRKAFIPHSPLDSGAYDLTQMIGPSNAILRGPDCPADAGKVGKDELWFYYTGLKYRGGWKYVGKFPHGKMVPMPGLDKDNGAVCLAVLRRDGFISLDAGETQGTIVGKPFKVPGSKLFVNIDAVIGEVGVEVLDEKEKVVAASAPMSGDHVRGEVEWTQGSLADLKGKTVSLRFTLRNGQLYSYWFE